MIAMKLKAHFMTHVSNLAVKIHIYLENKEITENEAAKSN